MLKKLLYSNFCGALDCFLKQAKSSHTKRDVLGTMTDLEQFLDHYGNEAKPSNLDVGQQLVIARVL